MTVIYTIAEILSDKQFIIDIDDGQGHVLRQQVATRDGESQLAEIAQCAVDDILAGQGETEDGETEDGEEGQIEGEQGA